MTTLLIGLESDMMGLATELGPDVHMSSHPEGAWASFRFARTNWPATPTEPVASIAFEWVKARVDPANANAPYVGIRAAADDVRSALKDLIATRYSALTKNGYIKGSYWPVYQPIPAAMGDDWWHDFAGWRQQLLAATADGWSNLAPIVDEVMLGETMTSYGVIRRS